MRNRSEVILVDEQDCPIGVASKQQAHQKGLLHRAFSVFIFSKTEEGLMLLLQQRALHKYHCPGLWTNTCCSHPQPGESVSEAAKERLFAEVGLDLPVKFVGIFQYHATLSNGLIESELDHVFVGFAPIDISLGINPKEVVEAKWVSMEALQVWLKKDSHAFTPWFQEALDIALQKIPPGESFYE